jgi:hypothetical protein
MRGFAPLNPRQGQPWTLHGLTAARSNHKIHEDSPGKWSSPGAACNEHAVFWQKDVTNGQTSYLLNTANEVIVAVRDEK